MREKAAKNNDFLERKNEGKCLEIRRFFAKENQTKGRKKRCF